MPDVLAEFGSRVERRSGIEVVLRIDETARLPHLQERELWRIAQEAIVNAERHSSAAPHRRVLVLQRHRGGGRGPRRRRRACRSAGPGRLDSYGMLGMRERAASIGATLSVDSIPRRGVTVRAALRSDR